VGTLLFGAQLAERSGLQDRLVTNQERFELLCKTLDDEDVAPPDRLAAIMTIIGVIDEYRFVGETGIRIETMIGAMQAAARNVLLCRTSLDMTLKQRLSDCLITHRGRNKSGKLFDGHCRYVEQPINWNCRLDPIRCYCSSRRDQPRLVGACVANYFEENSDYKVVKMQDEPEGLTNGDPWGVQSMNPS
jgi:hypothetical protein